MSTPVDFRCGADRLLVYMREVLGREPLDGSVYVFCNRRASRMVLYSCVSLRESNRNI